MQWRQLIWGFVVTTLIICLSYLSFNELGNQWELAQSKVDRASLAFTQKMESWIEEETQLRIKGFEANNRGRVEYGGWSVPFLSRI
ncbi:hypothetical protein IC619_014785 [Hazenella sp. IB182353]|uniref:hypothetical protein n=1 Tax=Polycladospora coralii TaxID=2771432 RepID=UPI001747325C|nr:hypothetical protein [Polycladospora coralii]MBS7531738.1 hypothetical protein [Polycladospora coralii]